MGEPPSGPQAKEKQAAQGSLFFGSPVWFLNAKISRWHVCVSEAWTCQAGRPSDHLVEVTYRRYGKHEKARATVSGVGQEGCWSLACSPRPICSLPSSCALHLVGNRDNSGIVHPGALDMNLGRRPTAKDKCPGQNRSLAGSASLSCESESHGPMSGLDRTFSGPWDTQELASSREVCHQKPPILAKWEESVTLKD